ncbi:hypothetical protein NQ314_015957 [Rhamnusium bicolor]|uniref:Generative cell specific-1/HAP2 domain-containing protein n=1 Tax=Rhamnusium bicolor TaxID=1586634 RepID=A0AAV8WYA5_9CUCU|nr:hypothetical protein NQ314_015957 [Rhamnusium bicolor]
MFYFKIQILLLYLQFLVCIYSIDDVSQIHEVITDEERNARCCAKHMGCCKKLAEPTNFEVRALLIKCAKPDRCSEMNKSKSHQNNRNQYNNQIGDQCEQKPKAEIPREIKNKKLLNPYVLKVKQQPIMQAYGLICENAVNSQASEKVINKKDSGYTGCNTDPSQNPTCGSVKYNNEVIPYSTGFCCSCNKDENEKNIDDANFTSNLKIPSVINDIEEPKKTRNTYTYNVPEVNKNNYQHYEFGDKIGKVKEDTLVVNVPNIMADNGDYSSPFHSANDEQLLPFSDCSNVDTSSYPELQGGSQEYLVANENQVQADGKKCNVAGVGYDAFAKQPKRCAVPKDSCLQNQPKQMWEHDHEAESSGKKGCYFLKYFGKLPENPIITDEKTQNKTLTMFYTECYTSVVDIEVKADANVILRPNSLAILTEVYVDSSNLQRTSIIAKVFNSGLVSSILLVSLTDCPLDMPASFNNISNAPLPKRKLLCAVEVQNTKDELIAVRKICLQKLDRCICIWHCLCACLLADSGLKCKPMSLEHYHAAGFQGGLPVALHVVHYTFLDDMISLMLYILLFLCLTLIIMGLTKALVGCCVVSVGLWGLDLILDLPKKMNSYYESSIRHRQVIYDENGWPIHPDSKERVRNISLPAEFCINVVFFYIYPFAVLWTIIKKLCFSSYSQPKDYSDLDICKCSSGTVLQKKKQHHTKQINKKNKSQRPLQKGKKRKKVHIHSQIASIRTNKLKDSLIQ